MCCKQGNGCTQNRNFWRIKFDLQAKFKDAKRGFENIFGSPYNLEFAPQLSINIDDNGYAALSETSITG